jgi:hypothetical protein
MKHINIYNKLIERAKNRELEGYSEIHHIIPKCQGGLDNKENLVKLTAKEHFLAHKLLVEIYPDNTKLLYALWMMAIGMKKSKTRDPYNVTSRDYERIRLLYINKRTGTTITKKHKLKIGKRNSKPVIQYSLDGNIITKFNSSMEAERQLTNRPEAHWKELNNNINDCCRLKQKSAYGFIWKYEGETLHLNQHLGSNNCVKGKKIIYKNKEYPTIINLKKETGISNYMFYKMVNENKIKYVN